MPTFTLNDLEQRVQARATESADMSYTRKLLDRGVAHCAKKLGEEAVETVLAAVSEDREPRAQRHRLGGQERQQPHQPRRRPGLVGQPGQPAIMHTIRGQHRRELALPARPDTRR